MGGFMSRPLFALSALHCGEQKYRSLFLHLSILLPFPYIELRRQQVPYFPWSVRCDPRFVTSSVCFGYSGQRFLRSVSSVGGEGSEANSVLRELANRHGPDTRSITNGQLVAVHPKFSSLCVLVWRRLSGRRIYLTPLTTIVCLILECLWRKMKHSMISLPAYIDCHSKKNI